MAGQAWRGVYPASAGAPEGSAVRVVHWTTAPGQRYRAALSQDNNNIF